MGSETNDGKRLHCSHEWQANDLIMKLLPGGVFSLLIVLLLFSIVLRVNNKDVLTGVALDSMPEWSLPGVMDGSYQRDWGNWLDDNFYGHTSTVKLHNQLQYSVFRDGGEDFGLGKDFTLFSRDDSYGYAAGARANPPSPEAINDFANRVLMLQNSLERLGKDFVYLIVPAKVEVYPELMAWNYRLLAKQYVDKDETAHEMLANAFHEYGVHYLDVTDMLKQMKGDVGFDVFAKTGHHWSLTAVASAMNTIFDEMDSMTQHIQYPRIDVVGLTDQLYGIDMDLYSSENVFFGVFDEKYLSPIVEYSERSGASVYHFGTSMGNQIMDACSESGVEFPFRRYLYQSYFTYQVLLENNQKTNRTFSEGDPIANLNVMQNIRDSDLIIMEQPGLPGIYDTHARFVDYVNQNIDEIYYNLGDNLMTYSADMIGAKLEGFYGLEPWGQWSNGTCSATVLGDAMADPGSDLALKLKMFSYYADQMVDVVVNGKTVTTLQVSPTEETYEVLIPEEVILDDENLIELCLKNKIYSPKRTGESEDARLFGLAIHFMSVEGTDK